LFTFYAIDLYQAVRATTVSRRNVLFMCASETNGAACSFSAQNVKKVLEDEQLFSALHAKDKANADPVLEDGGKLSSLLKFTFS
jgi:hypothetical protein